MNLEEIVPKFKWSICLFQHQYGRSPGSSIADIFNRTVCLKFGTRDADWEPENHVNVTGLSDLTLFGH